MNLTRFKMMLRKKNLSKSVSLEASPSLPPPVSLYPFPPLQPVLHHSLSREMLHTSVGNDVSLTASSRCLQENSFCDRHSEVSYTVDTLRSDVIYGDALQENKPDGGLTRIFKRMTPSWHRQTRIRATSSINHGPKEPITARNTIIRTMKRWITSSGLRKLDRVVLSRIRDRKSSNTKASNIDIFVNIETSTIPPAISEARVENLHLLDRAAIQNNALEESSSSVDNNVPNTPNPPADDFNNVGYQVSSTLPPGVLFSSDIPPVTFQEAVSGAPTSSFNSLPTELIHEIFLCCIYQVPLGEDHQRRLRNNEAPLILSWVCQQWRKIMSGSIFKIIDVTFGSMFDTFIDRIPSFGDVQHLEQLSLEVCDTISNDLAGCQSGWMYLQNHPSVTKQLVRALDLVPKSKAIGIALPYCNAIEYIQEPLEGRPWTLRQVLDTLRADPTRLEAFSWKWNVPLGRSFPTVFPRMDANYKPSVSKWQNLKHLSLGCDIEMQQLIQLVDDFGTQLISLSLEHVTANMDDSPNPQTSSVLMKNLQSLRLKASISLAPFLQPNSTPSLRRLDLVLTNADGNDSLPQLPIPWGILQKLRLRAHLQVDDLCEIINNCQNIVDLCLEGEPRRPGFDLLNFEAAPIAMKKLQSLKVSSNDLYTEMLVNCILKSPQSLQLLNSIDLPFIPKILRPSLQMNDNQFKYIRLDCPLELIGLAAILQKSSDLIRGEFSVAVPKCRNKDPHFVELSKSQPTLVLHADNSIDDLNGVLKSMLSPSILARTTIVY